MLELILVCVRACPCVGALVHRPYPGGAAAGGGPGRVWVPVRLRAVRAGHGGSGVLQAVNAAGSK